MSYNQKYNGTIVDKYQNKARRHHGRKRWSDNSKSKNNYLHNAHKHSLTNPEQIKPQLVNVVPQPDTQMENVVSTGGFLSRFFSKLSMKTKKPKIFVAQETRDNKNYRNTHKYREDDNSSTVMQSFYNKKTGERITRTLNVTTEKEPCFYFHERGYCKRGDACWYKH
jgi:hypothetical protein